MVGCCDVDNEPSSLIEVVEFFDRGFVASEESYSSELDVINKLILFIIHGSVHRSMTQEK
jgi:hypothetical protein